MINLDKDVQSAKAPLPMCVTEFGISSLVNDWQPAKPQICVTDSGIFKLFRAMQRVKAPGPI